MAQGRDPGTLLQDPERLKRRRIEAHLSQTALATKAGVTRGFIWQLEHSESSASVPTLGTIADVLGCKIADLMPEGALDDSGTNGESAA